MYEDDCKLGGINLLTEQYILYRLIDTILLHTDYKLIHLNLQDQEIFLAKKTWRKTKIIRLVQRTFDWSNHLKHDIRTLFQRIALLNRHLRSKEIEIYNVYISDLEPVDSWEELKDPLHVRGKNHAAMNVFFLSRNDVAKETDRLFAKLAIDAEVINDIPTIAEQEAYVRGVQHKLQQLLYEQNQKVKEIFTRGKPFFTFLFIYLNLFMYFLLEVNGGSTNIQTLIFFGAKENTLILAGEWWRIITSMFLHIGLLHLVMNMVALFYLGTVVERIYRSERFFVIYMLAGIGGSITSFAFNEHVAAGASGALFGLFGALLFFGTLHRQLFLQTMGSNLIAILLINLIFGFFVPQIDMGAHVGGLITGYIASAIVYLPDKKNLLVQTAALTVYGFYIIGCIYLRMASLM